MVIKMELKIIITLSITKIIIKLVIYNTRSTETIGQLWFIKSYCSMMKKQQTIVIQLSNYPTFVS